MAHETFDYRILETIKEHMKETDSLLDIGSGPCVMLDNLDFFSTIIALDIYRPYLINRVTRSPHIIPIHADALTIGKLFVPKSVSAVSLFDSLEHFTKLDGIKVLRDAEHIARKHVIIYTPRGYFPQEGIDHFGLNGEQYQAHHSGWEVEELEALGYKVIILKGQHNKLNPAFVRAFGADHEPVDALLAIKTM
ncbi:hypothetical protein [Paenibacillus sp. OV219]|uniref:hypothetical protein n=1 Tax=Paenibacillus sp. OV219 TaxID=1884377 RepID=UPI0008BB14A4|nr:hypothetical protein [Paenibacillus sp. OV219]SEO13845.1 hypothetical protein SAMN05518847_10647 [Paenibacillus sp. OV219]